MKQSWKWVVLALVLVLLAVGVAFAIVKATGVDKTKTIGSSGLSWQIGRLDEDGDLVEDSAYMMTKTHLGIDGLKVEVVKKPGVDVHVALFNKKGECINGTMDADEMEVFEITTSETEKTVWDCAEYLSDHSSVSEAKPAYAIVFLSPTKDVEITSSNLSTYAKMVTISYDR